MTRSKASAEGAAPEAITEPATDRQDSPGDGSFAEGVRVPKAEASTAVVTQEPEPQQSGEAFPSQHVIYLGVVKNQLEADLMRFDNGRKMLKARLDGQQLAYEDESRALKEEYERKRQERMDAHLSDMTRLKVQLNDIADVIETYETAIERVGQINARQAQIDADAADAVKEAIK